MYVCIFYPIDRTHYAVNKIIGLKTAETDGQRMDLPFDLTLMNKMKLIENYFHSASLFFPTVLFFCW